MTVTTTPAYRWRWLALVAVLAAEIMDLVDGTVVGIAAPSIRAELGGGDAVIQWVAAGYTLAFAAGLITGGRLGDLYGRRRMFLVGLVGFVAASALCGLATTPGTLIGFRITQGLLVSRRTDQDESAHARRPRQHLGGPGDHRPAVERRGLLERAGAETVPRSRRHDERDQIHVR